MNHPAMFPVYSELQALAQGELSEEEEPTDPFSDEFVAKMDSLVPADVKELLVRRIRSMYLGFAVEQNAMIPRMNVLINLPLEIVARRFEQAMYDGSRTDRWQYQQFLSAMCYVYRLLPIALPEYFTMLEGTDRGRLLSIEELTARAIEIISRRI